MQSLTLHKLSLFLHEGAHFNLASSKRMNEVLSNVLVGILLMVDVRTYRIGHMQHHRLVGSPDDPEKSYQSRFTIIFLLEALTGLRVLRIVRLRGSGNRLVREQRHRMIPAIGVSLYLGVLGVMILCREFRLALMFCISTFSVFPLIASSRQLLEHRASRANFNDGLHPMTRQFSTSKLGFLVGGAGFSRHLLHHWDPGVSYTNLAELERWLRGTRAKGILESRSASHLVTISRLWTLK